MSAQTTQIHTPHHLSADIQGDVGTGSTVETMDSNQSSQQMLQRCKQFLAFQSRSVVLFASDPEGNITFVSPSVRSVLGYEPEQVIGQHWSSFIDPTHPLNRSIPRRYEQRFAGDAPHRFNCVAMTAAGETKHVHLETFGVTAAEIHAEPSDISSSDRESKSTAVESDEHEVIENLGILTVVDNAGAVNRTQTPQRQALNPILDAVLEQITVDLNDQGIETTRQIQANLPNVFVDATDIQHSISHMMHSISELAAADPDSSTNIQIVGVSDAESVELTVIAYDLHVLENTDDAAGNHALIAADDDGDQHPVLQPLVAQWAPLVNRNSGETWYSVYEDA
ncbi:MAG: PAS domain-containing protein, partial [Planctomycetota bacterium]